MGGWVRGYGFDKKAFDFVVAGAEEKKKKKIKRRRRREDRGERR
jgi:hypothetical protein